MKFILIVFFMSNTNTLPGITAEFNSYEACNNAIQFLVKQRMENGYSGMYHGGCFAKGEEKK